MSTCPVCKTPLVLDTRGRFPPHLDERGQHCMAEGCLPTEDDNASEREAAPIVAADAQAARKSRSDKGTKRGQRKKGGENPVSAAEGPRVPAGLPAAPGGPPSQAEERVALPDCTGCTEPDPLGATHSEGTKQHPTWPTWGGLPKETGVTASPAQDKSGKTVRKPRSDRSLYLVLIGTIPPVTSYKEACAEARRQAGVLHEGATVTVYAAHPRLCVLKGGLVETTLGRTRKARSNT